MTTKDFNKKYKLNIDNIENPFNFAPKTNNFSNVAGKPKKLVIEIFKRFFLSWPSVLFLIVFLIVLITSLVVSSYSPYNADNSVENTIQLNLIGDKIGQSTKTGSSFVKSLPSLWSGKINSDFVLSDRDFSANARFWANPNNYGGYLWAEFDQAQYISYNLESGTRFIDFYKWHEVDSINIIFKESKIPLNITAAEAKKYYAQALEANPQIHLKTFLGTTNSGIDIWTQSWIGTWRAIRLALIVATLQTIIGVAIGSYLGFHVGTAIDTVIMRLIDIFSAPPTLIWLLLFATLFGTTDLTLGFALVFVGWVGSVGRTRLFIITVKDSEFITASQSIGASKARLIYKHALPSIIGKIATSYVASIPSIILSVSSLAFLGFFQSDNANLGKIISSAPAEAAVNVWVLLLPSLILLSISVSLHFIALGVHDALDPKIIKSR
ncbi:peptide/nickel transport system permease protein [Mycoplasmopsis canis PG 14]|uniref:Oligopeptide transport system permease protein oppC n=1 Tax=Mycoplasmopsis canis TaxID=29555 RepID=A0A449ARN4_9BACT|nr:ABC transporter permease [Mycoplasmopsis canis]AMD81188.1 peptide ABC transporter permease [Mycoplasmopsis canis PG 14]EIE39747.1 peptide/nickel transport system permease protein [Mycoplasmopsis canis PG 14]VEU69012.1 Oligopeptide transport system permease protein oppC [Mycoplasmopsis canis]